MSEDARRGVAGVVVNYNARDYLLSCVGSLLAEGVALVVVADNGSTDGSEMALLERYPEAKWVPTGANLGYGTAANIGAAVVDSRYLLICNADVVVGQGSVDGVAELPRRPARRGSRRASHPWLRRRPVPLGPAVPRPPRGVRARDRRPVLGRATRFRAATGWTDWDHAEAREVDWVSGACFLARRSAWDAVGGFDRAYFMYMEDVDLCWRLRASRLVGRVRAGRGGHPRPGGVGRPPPLPDALRPPRFDVALCPADRRTAAAAGCSPWSWSAWRSGSA